MVAKLSQFEIDERLISFRNRNIEMLSDYQGAGKKHQFKCLDVTCGYSWSAKFNSVSSGRGCAICSGTVLTDDMIKQRIATINSRSIKLLGCYVGASVRYDFQCVKPECNHVWNTTFSSVFHSKKGCAKCAGLFIDESTLQARIEGLRLRSIKLLSSYKGTGKHHDFKCLRKNCGHSWRALWGGVYRGEGCPKCAGKIIDEKQILEATKSLAERLIKPTEPYIKSRRKVKFKCLRLGCEYIWSSSWGGLSKSQSGCPRCAKKALSDSDILDRIAELKSRSIELVHPYTSMQAKAEFMCTKTGCNHTWMSTLSNVYHSKSSCSRCIGRNLTTEEKTLSSYRNRIRNRISTIFRGGSIPVAIHRDSEYMSKVFDYCKTQIDKLPQKPNNDQKWQLDHIIPVAKFDHLDIEQVKLCWDYRNLQWLPAKVNRLKSAKLLEEYFTDWHYDVLNRLGLKL